MKSYSSRERFGFQFSTISRLWRRHLDHRMADAGQPRISWAPLIHLDEAGDGINQKVLAARIGMQGSSLVRHLDHLEQIGHITRRPDPDDRRTKRLYLTPAGCEAIAEIRAYLQQAEKEMLAETSDAELETLLSTLEGVGRRIEALETIRSRS